MRSTLARLGGSTPPAPLRASLAERLGCFKLQADIKTVLPTKLRCLSGSITGQGGAAT